MNVKAGDMALVINSVTGRAIGKICEVLRPSAGNGLAVGSSFVDVLDGSPVRQVSIDNNFYWIVRFKRKIRSTWGVYANEVLVRDSWLRPISGIPDTEEENKEKELEK